MKDQFHIRTKATDKIIILYYYRKLGTNIGAILVPP
jgi:hypothetical protein